MRPDVIASCAASGVRLSPQQTLAQTRHHKTTTKDGWKRERCLGEGAAGAKTASQSERKSDVDPHTSGSLSGSRMPSGASVGTQRQMRGRAARSGGSSRGSSGTGTDSSVFLHMPFATDDVKDVPVQMASEWCLRAAKERQRRRGSSTGAARRARHPAWDRKECEQRRRASRARTSGDGTCDVESGSGRRLATLGARPLLPAGWRRVAEECSGVQSQANHVRPENEAMPPDLLTDIDMWEDV